MNIIAAVTTPSMHATLDLLPDLICVVSPERRGDYFNKAWRTHANGSSDDFASDSWVNWIIPEDQEKIEQALRLSLETGEQQVTECRLTGCVFHSPDCRGRWFLFRAVPHRDGNGTLQFWFHILTDVHEQKTREQETRHTAHLRMAMLNVSSDCIKVINTDGTLAHMNEAGCTALSVNPNSGFGMKWLPLLPEAAWEPGEKALNEVRNGVEARFGGLSKIPGQPPRYWDNILTPLFNISGSVEAILCVSRDVSTVKENEERIGLLLREVTHRSRNMLTVVRAMLRRTVPDPREPFVTALDQRINAIARGLDLLVREQWTGARIEDIVTAHTAAHGAICPTRLRIDGDSHIRLRTEAVEKIGLAIHELMTNAVLHGAFSNDTGTVMINWRIEGEGDDALFRLRWKERGGPPLTEPPSKGFGTAVIERNPRGIEDAHVIYLHETEGVSWEFTAPVRRVLT
ncbi:PAS domain-containing protein [Acetobacter sp.]|jgi:PAS domain S-box-containing protein|uniref:PAS domain-containing protein n=1 Tax=Acetobacter sp. TaxID=440 RepID=UPI0025C4F68B|nr:PAS domain-containing protein [Acetobacter sp.]MCH4091515.1 PAS domain-containing protein [Acetobacter sp.]MCI1299493.1 PAS domain-containing protein [Acetobacter sp.]MCI1316917.1 PAS domain-containing protein [Acetobacter sp.]